MTNAGRLQGGHAQPTESANPTGRTRSPTLGDTPIGELVDGLHEVAALPIAYARLPRRAHTAFAEDFTCWGDIAGQTIESLLSRPKIGERAVQALLAAAKDAVAGYQAAALADRVGANAAARGLLNQLDERDHELLARLWAAQPQPQRALAERLYLHARHSPVVRLAGGSQISSRRIRRGNGSPRSKRHEKTARKELRYHRRERCAHRNGERRK